MIVWVFPYKKGFRTIVGIMWLVHWDNTSKKWHSSDERPRKLERLAMCGAVFIKCDFPKMGSHLIKSETHLRPLSDRNYLSGNLTG